MVNAPLYLAFKHITGCHFMSLVPLTSTGTSHISQEFPKCVSDLLVSMSYMPHTAYSTEDTKYIVHVLQGAQNYFSAAHTPSPCVPILITVEWL